MAKRRMISQELIHDEEVNSLSLEAQYLFTRLIVISDDCGVVPAAEYTLKSLVNPSDRIKNKFSQVMEEIIKANLLIPFELGGKKFYCFKRKAFEDYQAYLIKNRTRSEYLKIKVDEFLELYKSLRENPENPGNSRREEENESYQIKSKEHKDIIKSNEKGGRNFKSIPPAIEEVQELFMERGYPPEEAERFFNYYQSNGWKVGKNPMKDWGAASATWFVNFKKFSNGGKGAAVNNGKGYQGVNPGKFGLHGDGEAQS